MNRRHRGLALIELLFAVALAALISAALGSLIGLLLQTQSQAHASQELANQARFALRRVTATVRSGSAATSGSGIPQLAVTVGTRTVSYSFNAGAAQLSETDSATGTTSVIADNVSAFTATLATRVAMPANYGTLTAGGTLATPVAQVSLTLAGSGLTLPAKAYARVGGGL